MKVNSKSYPHPVLGNEDDLNGRFTVDFHYELGREEVVLNPVFNLQNAGIEDLLKQGKASLIAEVECRNTFFRKSFAAKKLIERFSIPSKLLRERVTVGFYVCATQDLHEYRPSEPHPDYEGATFNLEAGDVLAVGGYCSFIAEKNFDPLKPQISSFMAIKEGSHHEGPVQIDYENDKITIILSKSDWKNYLEVRGQKLAEGILHASVVFPALIDAIYQVSSKDSDYEAMNWHGRIGSILDSKGLREKDSFEAAQKILENPVTRSFQSISSLFEVTNEQEYE